MGVLYGQGLFKHNQQFLTQISPLTPESHLDMCDISVPRQINEPLPGSKLMVGASQVSSSDWQVSDEAVTSIGQWSSKESSGESAIFYQHAHTDMNI